MKPVVAVDFDGVLCNYEDGWKGINCFGPPIEGAKEFLVELHKHADILIFTCRCTEGLHKGFRKEYLRSRVAEWLEKHEMPFDEIYTEAGKPVCKFYVDDRGINCNPLKNKNAFTETLDIILAQSIILKKD